MAALEKVGRLLMLKKTHTSFFIIFDSCMWHCRGKSFANPLFFFIWQIPDCFLTFKAHTDYIADVQARNMKTKLSIKLPPHNSSI